MLYDARQAEISDQLTRIKSAEEKGREKGREEGREKGREEGREEGATEKAIEAAINFLRLGVNEEIVAKGTGIPIEKVIELKKKYQN
jgi:predicted transposase YdaD